MRGAWIARNLRSFARGKGGVGVEMKELKKRKSPRCQSYDYNSVGVFFITICTQSRQPILSRIVGTGVPDCPQVGTGVPDCPQVILTGYGEIANKYIKQLDDFYNHVSVQCYVIMPNHIHLLLWVKENNGTSGSGQSGTPVPTNVRKSNTVCSQFVSTFKRFCNKEYGGNIWQARFNDHIIRNREDYEKHLRYIHENPLRWHYDELYQNS